MEQLASNTSGQRAGRLQQQDYGGRGWEADRQEVLGGWQLAGE